MNKGIKETIGPQSRYLRRRWRRLLYEIPRKQKKKKKRISKIISKCMLFLKHFLKPKLNGHTFFQPGWSHICDLKHKHVWESVKSLSLKVLVEERPRPYMSPFPPAPGPPEMSGYQNGC